MFQIYGILRKTKLWKWGREISGSQGIVSRDIVNKQAIVLAILFDAVPKCPTEK